MEPNVLTTTISLNVYGPVNNLSVATAIYNWYKDCRDPDINLDTIIGLLEVQMNHDNEKSSIDDFYDELRGRCMDA